MQLAQADERVRTLEEQLEHLKREKQGVVRTHTRTGGARDRTLALPAPIGCCGTAGKRLPCVPQVGRYDAAEAELQMVRQRHAHLEALHERHEVPLRRARVCARPSPVAPRGPHRATLPWAKRLPQRNARGGAGGWPRPGGERSQRSMRAAVRGWQKELRLTVYSLDEALAEKARLERLVAEQPNRAEVRMT
jgi:hypothetical protein